MTKKISIPAILIMAIHNLSEESAINLAGDSLCDKDTLAVNISHSERFQLEIQCDSDLFFVQRRINFQEKTIINYFMKVYDGRNRTGTKIFLKEVIEARKSGFKKFEVSAAKSDDFNGYYTWARLGYSIAPWDEPEFFELMNNHNRTETSLPELMSTEDGRNFWKKNGFWFQGEFDLADKSPNIIAFKDYLDEKGIISDEL